MILNHVFVMFQHNQNNLNILHGRTHKRKQNRQMNCFDTSSSQILLKIDTFCDNTLILAELHVLLKRLHHLKTFWPGLISSAGSGATEHFGRIAAVVI